MITKLILLAIFSGALTGIFIVIYGLLTKILSFVLFLGDPFETVPELPVWCVYLVPTVSIFIINYI